MSDKLREALLMAEAAIGDAIHAVAIYGDDPPAMYREALSAVSAALAEPSEVEQLKAELAAMTLERDGWKAREEQNSRLLDKAEAELAACREDAEKWREAICRRTRPADYLPYPNDKG